MQQKVGSVKDETVVCYIHKSTNARIVTAQQLSIPIHGYGRNLGNEKRGQDGCFPPGGDEASGSDEQGGPQLAHRD